MIQLRPYQNDLVSEIRGAMRRNRKVLAVSPTGSGKTVIFSYITFCSQIKNSRIYIIAHRSEIIDQISRALSDFNIRHGRIQPGWTPTTDPVQVAMIQTIARRIDKLPEPDMVIIDESHHAVNGSYSALIERYTRAKILGVTATPERLDGRGLGEQFETMVQGPSTRWLIENEFLADFDYYAPPIKMDLSGVKVRMGDYEAAALAEAVDKPTITGEAVSHYRKFLPGKKAIAFCITIAHAEHVAENFRANGIPAQSIDGSMTKAERAHRVAALKSGEIMVLTSCDLISEGFDVPSVSGAIMLRPSKSLAMVLQQWGRCLRLKDDGSKAIILDHVGHVNQFGTPKTERKWSLESKKRKESKSGVRQCKSCFRAFMPEDEASCTESYDNEDCLFHAKQREKFLGSGREIEQRDGELVAFSESPEWAKGINIIRASGAEFKALMARADSLDKLKMIGKLRGYHPRWALHAWNRRQHNG